MNGLILKTAFVFFLFFIYDQRIQTQGICGVINPESVDDCLQYSNGDNLCCRLTWIPEGNTQRVCAFIPRISSGLVPYMSGFKRTVPAGKTSITSYYELEWDCGEDTPNSLAAFQCGPVFPKNADDCLLLDNRCCLFRHPVVSAISFCVLNTVTQNMSNKFGLYLDCIRDD
jgi:hypothetical protein